MVNQTTAVLIVAAGRGSRAQTDIPKQYVEIGGKPILRHTIERFLTLPEIDRVTVVIAAQDRALYAGSIHGLNDPRITLPVIGGGTRAQSVCAGLESMISTPPDRVLIHDAARPFVAQDAIRQVIKVLDVHEGTIVAIPATDAIWRADGGFAISPQDRSVLWHAQTPQGFRFTGIVNAHRNYHGVAVDDATVARAAGMLVQIVPGTPQNFKITTPADMARARAYLSDIEPSGEV
ncbi:2-C-methyl-D-erythritol 4-phosphate cytidylyltransferase [Rhodobacteraceae bacterium]|nr:2-C-methyl-D-erythritol 4-phosphate cytidylyltransferase [Paracoccaceae bacterium]